MNRATMHVLKRAMVVMLLIAPVVAWGGTKVSSFQKETKKGANYWSGGAAIDGKLETAWMLPGESANRGEWIEVDLPRGTVDKFVIVAGYAKDEETFKDYSRVKQLRIDFFSMNDDQGYDQVSTVTVEIKDEIGLQLVDVPDIKVGGDLFGGKAKISIVDIYAGVDYPISEISFILSEFEIAPTVISVSGEGSGHPKDHALDEDVKTFWSIPEAEAGFSLNGNSYGISSVGFQCNSKDYARAKTVEITLNGLMQRTVLEDKPGTVQWAKTAPFNGYTGGATGDVEVKIIDSYPGAKSQEICLTTLKLQSTNAMSF
jgi:hypothetical protein